ncbi:MAG: nucleotidyl transferase AbiEii/AbiGii toxin family protein [bacterium]
MRDLLLTQLASLTSTQDKRNRLRRSLQVVLLKILHESPAGGALAFTGGTALHFLYELPRFSEDLDFSLVRRDRYSPDALTVHLQGTLAQLALPAEVKSGATKTVHNISIRFPELLADAAITSNKKEKMPIRLEIDTRPPAGWDTQISLISDLFTIPILHFDLPSSFATKLHACLFRRYAKGRDFYDLMWYLGKKVPPNLKVLNHAIEQTEEDRVKIDPPRLKILLLERLDRLDISRLRQDVAPFLQRSEEADLLEKSLMQHVVSNYEF